MKKLCLAITCIVGLALLTACSSEKKAPTVTGDEQVDQKVEQVEKKLSEMTGPEKCEATWAKRYNGKVKLADVQPDFDFAEQTKGFDQFEGNGVNMAKAVYQKKDGSAITPEEWKAFVTKIYGVTKTLAQDGKNVKGFGSNIDVKTREQALVEVPLETLLAGDNSLEWAFLKDDRFEACYVTLMENAKPSYVVVTIGEGTQKNLEEAMKDAEKYLK